MAEDRTLPTDPAKLIEHLDKLCAFGRASRSDFQAKMNLAFLMGQQWAGYDPVTKTLVPPRTDASNPRAPIRMTINKIGSHVERAVARLTKNSPVPECQPVSQDDDDIMAARAGTHILQHELRRTTFDSELSRLYFWVVPCGYAYAQLTWGPELGASLGSAKGVEVRAGEVALDLLPFFELAVDPVAPTMTSARWACREVALTRDEVWERWGKEPTRPQYASTVMDEMRRLLDLAYTAQKRDTWVVVKQFWLRRGSRSRPEGLVVTWCGETVLEDPKSFPYAHDRLPFVQFNLLPGLGRREGRTWVSDLVPMQVDYNDARSREAEQRRTIAPKLFYAEGQIDPKRVTSRVDLIPFKPIGPTPFFHIPDSGWMQPSEAAMTRSDNEMAERSSVTSATRGELLSGLAAAALMAAQEAADTPLANSIKERATSLSELGWQWLMLVKQHWKEERLVRTRSSSGGRLEVASFSGADLPSQLDIHVASEDSFLRSKAARLQFVTEMLDKGLIQNPVLAFRAIGADIPGMDTIFSDVNEDVTEAEDENDLLMQGLPVLVEKWQNSVVHSFVHNKLRKTRWYRNLARDPSPESLQIKALIDAHVDLHDSLIPTQVTAPGPIGSPGSVPISSPPARNGARPSLSEFMGIGRPTQPGPIPGISPDLQSGRMGS